jgi:hypothetical protein
MIFILINHTFDVDIEKHEFYKNIIHFIHQIRR